METRNCQNCKNDFNIEPDDFSFYEKIKVPAPTFCPECRQIRRMVWRSLRSLYKRECHLCHNTIISMYPDTDPAPVMCNDCYNGDGWDPKSYGIEIDWERPFLSQWLELFQKVPRLLNYRNGVLINSDYSNYSIGNKDVYLAFSVINCENISYSENIDKSRDCLDCLGGQNLDQCFYNIDCEGNFNSHYMIQSRACMDSLFLFDCANCQNCCLSTNLRNQQYIFANRKVSKEEYKRLVEELKLSSRNGIKNTSDAFFEIMENAVFRYANIYNSQNTTGDFISNSKNIVNGFDVHEGEDIKNASRIISSKDAQDCYGILTGELEYETTACSVQSYNCRFSHICLTSKNVEYSILCRGVSDCFGCANVKGGQYIILNKQYTKEEFEEIVPRLRQHMMDMPYVDKMGRVYKYGEFFPFEFCPFGYNESVAHDYFRLEKEQALTRGYNWKDREKRGYNITVQTEDIPDDISTVDESILQETLSCAHKGECNHQCTNAFRISQNELIFLKQKKLPLSDLCPNCRHYERVDLRNPPNIWDRVCMCDKENHIHVGKCEVEFKTAYAPEKNCKVYCEKCYQQEVL